MELAIEVPQPRLRAVPSEPVPQPPDDSPSDAELLARVGERDREAFEILYGRYVRPVFGLALRRLGDRGHAEDAVQEAFAAIWRSASTYRLERGAAGGWEDSGKPRSYGGHGPWTTKEKGRSPHWARERPLLPRSSAAAQKDGDQDSAST